MSLKGSTEVEFHPSLNPLIVFSLGISQIVGPAFIKRVLFKKLYSKIVNNLSSIHEYV